VKVRANAEEFERRNKQITDENQKVKDNITKQGNYNKGPVSKNTIADKHKKVEA